MDAVAVLHAGAITWHAHPHNAQYELYDESLLRYSFDFTHELDARFGFKPKHTAILVSCCHYHRTLRVMPTAQYEIDSVDQ